MGVRLICFFFIFCSTFFFSQKNNDSAQKKFYYSLKYIPDSTSQNIVYQEEFVLIVNGNKSLFTDVINKKADSMEIGIRQDFINNKLSNYSFKGVPHAKFSYYIKKDLQDNSIQVFDKIGNKNFSYQEASKSYQWQVTSETKLISGMHCQLAKTKAYGRIFYARFTKEIPIPDGPYKFCNLPGLILEVYDSKKQYHFEIVRFNPNEAPSTTEIPDFRLRKIIETKKDIFVKAKNTYSDTTVERLKDSFVGSAITDDKVKEIKERLKKNNNPLELTP